jgi:4-hydroxy-3-methylbut-2-enyl diphosphate reductase
MIEAVAQEAPELVVAAALRLEARALRRGAPALAVVRAGMGPERARRAASRLRADRASRLAVAGVCGGLAAEQPVGEVIVASSVGLVGDAPVPCEHAALAAALRERGLAPRVGPIVSVDHVVRGEERAALCETGALAVDMESAWLAAAAEGRPFAVLRVVLDAPGREIVRPGVALDAFRALRRLSEAAPALLDWATEPISGHAAPARPS